MSKLQEIFKPIKGFEGRYEISNLGRIKSITGKKETFYLGNIDTAGYRAFSLRFKKGGIPRKCIRVHQLVAEAFLDKPRLNERLEIDHINSDRLDNIVTNLRWCTVREHRGISIKKGEFDKKGENHHNSKLTERLVFRLRIAYLMGFDCKEISGMYNLNRRTVYDAVVGNTWKHI